VTRKSAQRINELDPRQKTKGVNPEDRRAGKLLRINIYIAVAACAVPFVNHGLAFAQIDINAFSLYGLA